MSPAVGPIYFDTCTLSSFASVGRLSLLQRSYGHRATWTETVQWEVERGLGREPILQDVLDAGWLGEPVEISCSPRALKEISNIQRALGGVSARSTDHLGEAEIIFHLSNVETDGVFATDDGFALDLARRRGIRCLESADILAECYAMGDVGCPEAYEVLCAMVDANRGVRLPSTHSDVC